MKPGWPWPLLIAALLALGVGVNLALMVAATGDPSFSVEPDYYTKAVRWDDRMAQEARNAGLGWRVEVDAVPEAEGCRVAVSIVDRAGVAVADADVSLEAFHNARASTVLTAALVPTGAGYAALLPMRRAGLWEFRIAARRGPTTFTAVLTRDVAIDR